MLKTKLLFVVLQTVIVAALVYISTFLISLQVLNAPYSLSHNQKLYYLIAHPLMATALSWLICFISLRRKVTARFAPIPFAACLAILIVYYYDLLFVSKYAWP